MKCKYCGEEFEQAKRGRKKSYCNKENCIRQARNEANRKWYANRIKKELEGAKHKIIENEQDSTIVYSSNDRIDYKLTMPDVGDIKALARELGATIYQLVELIKKERNNLSQYDKADQDFLHKLENLEELTDQEAINLVIKEKKNRESRRNNKIRIYLIQNLLNGITIKNPPAFVEKGIQICKTQKYTPRLENEEVKE